MYIVKNVSEFKDLKSTLSGLIVFWLAINNRFISDNDSYRTSIKFCVPLCCLRK
jgi:hypothetical protein